MNKYTISITVLALLIIGAIYYTNAPQSLVQKAEDKITGTTIPSQFVSITNSSATTTATTSVPIAAGDKTITQKDNGKTLHIKQGSRVVISLGEMDWTLNFSTPGVLNRIKNIAALLGSQGVYTADTVGTTVLTAEGRPHCEPGEMCAQYIVNVTTTIVVEK